MNPTENEENPDDVEIADLAPPAPELRVEHGMQMDPRPWWKVWIGRAFRWHPPSPELLPWAADGLVVNVGVDFSFLDRVRILLTGRINVRSWTACENLPGRAETPAASVVVRPWAFCE